MTKKHFELIAKIIKNNTDKKTNNIDKNDLISDFSDYFSKVNPLFDKTKFILACID